MNVMKLKGKIREKGLTQAALAREINIDKSTLQRKFKKTDSFTIGEVERITYILNLSDSEAMQIFLH